MTRSLPEVLSALGAPRLLVVGDLIVDRYTTGAVDRISPEAPIQVLRVESEVEQLGGAGAVAQNVAVLGAQVTLLGLLGDDRSGARMRALAQEAGVDLADVPGSGPSGRILRRDFEAWLQRGAAGSARQPKTRAAGE